MSIPGDYACSVGWFLGVGVLKRRCWGLPGLYPSFCDFTNPAGSVSVIGILRQLSEVLPFRQLPTTLLGSGFFLRTK
jgi:hypothetical protein